MKKFLLVLFHILTFPALIALVLLVDWNMIVDEFNNYGIYVLVGLIVAVVMTIIYYIAFICNVKSKKKSVTRQTISLILVVFFTLTGLWVVLDFALPDFLADATSKTLYYEDLVDNYEARMVVNKALLDEYITRNFNNGNLPDEKHGGYTLDEYLSQGLKNEKINLMLTVHFASIDTNGYQTFLNPWIGMANDDRLTIPTLIHLLTDEREWDPEIYDQDAEELLKELEVNDKFKWNILDMMGTDMEVALELDDGMSALVEMAVPAVSDDVAIITEGLLDSPIYLSYNGKAIVLTPSNESRGVLDYMSMAWLNSNGLLYAVVALMSLRNIFLAMGAWIIVANFIMGVIRGMGKEEKEERNPSVKAVKKEAPAYTAVYGPVYPYGATVDYAPLDMSLINRSLMEGAHEEVRRRK